MKDMRRSDNSPVGYTCSTIDEVISCINSIEDCSKAMLEDEITDEKKIELWEDIEYYALDAKRSLESIRKDNSDLREWGNNLYYELEEKDYELQEYKKKFEEMEERYDILVAEFEKVV